jgi:hypothetical protein
MSEGVFFVSASPVDVVGCLTAALSPNRQSLETAYPFTPQLIDGLHVFENGCLSASTIASFAQPDGAVMRLVSGRPLSDGSIPRKQDSSSSALDAARVLHESLLVQVEGALGADSESDRQGGRASAHTHVFTATEDELFDRGALRDLARKRGGVPVGHSPGVLRAYYAAVEGRATSSPLLFGSCLTVQEPITFHLLAQYCRDVTGLDAEGVAAAFLPVPPPGLAGDSFREPALWQAALPSATLTASTAVLVPRTFVLLSRYPCFDEQQRCLLSIARGWQARVAGELRVLLGLSPPLPRPLHDTLAAGDERRPEETEQSATHPVSSARFCRWEDGTGSDCAAASSSPVSPLLGPDTGVVGGSNTPVLPSSARAVNPTIVAEVVAQGTYRWELACRLHRVQTELRALAAEHSAHPPAPMQLQQAAFAANGGVTPAVKRASSGVVLPPGFRQPPSPAAGAGHPIRAATPSPAAVAATGHPGTPMASAAHAPGQPFLSFTERSRYEARLRDLQTHASRLGFLLADVTNRLRIAGQLLLTYSVRKAFEGPLQVSVAPIAELLSLQAPRPGERAAAPSAGFFFCRPQRPWGFATAAGSALPRTASPGNQLVRLLRCFVEEVAPFDPESDAMDAPGATAVRSEASNASTFNPWQLGCDVRHPETLHALRGWALPFLCSTLSPDTLVDVLAAALTEHNIVFVAEAPFDEGGSLLAGADASGLGPSAGGSRQRVVDGVSLSRCVLGLSCCLSPLAWEQNLRPSVPLATAQALLAAGPDVLAQTNLLGVRTMGNLPTAAPRAAAAVTDPASVTVPSTEAGQPAAAGTPLVPFSVNTLRSTSEGFAGGTPGSSPTAATAAAEPPTFPTARAHSVSFSFAGTGRGPQPPAVPPAAPPTGAPLTPSPVPIAEAHGRRRSLDLSSIMASLTPAPKPTAQQPSAAQRTATQRSAAAAAAELVLVSATSGRAYFYGEGGGLPISETASNAASVCRLPGREDLIAAVQRAYGDAFPPTGQTQAGQCGTIGSAGTWGAAQLSAAAAVADAVSAHIRWMLANLYVAALPPLLVDRGAATPRNTDSGGRGASLSAPLFHRPSPPDAESAARADLLAHLPSAKQLQRTVLSTIPFWRRFTETQILHQHHQMRAGRAFSAAFKGAEPVLLSDSSSVLEAAIDAVARRLAAAAAALSPPPLFVAPSPVP